MHRVLELDFAKFVAIILVTLGHSIQIIGRSNCFEDPLFSTIYSFHMPLFIMISGFFFISSLKLSFCEMLSRKTVSLILPVLSYAIPLFIALAIYKRTFPPFIILINSIGNIWFLLTLFNCYILLFVMLKSRVCFTLGLLLLLLGAFVGILQKTIFLFPYFLVGYLIRKNYDIFLKYNYLIVFSSFIFFIILLSFWNADYTIYRTQLKWIQNGMFNISVFYITVYRYFIGLAGSLFVLSFSILLGRSEKIHSVFYSIGGKTLTVYLIQMFAMFYLGVLGISLKCSDSYWIELLVALGIVVLGCGLHIYFSKYKLLSVLFLGKYGLFK